MQAQPTAFAAPTQAAPASDPRVEQGRRQTMVDCQIRTFDVTDQRVIARFLEVPREDYVPVSQRELAYSDVGLQTTPGAAGRYLLPPLVLARLIQGARVTARDRVLDVAAGFGYSTAILAGLAAEVIALEETPDLREALARRLANHDGARVRTLDGDLAAGAAEDGPFDAILVNGVVEANLDALLAQLAENGRLVTIMRHPGDPTGRASKATCFVKRNGETGSQYLFDATAPLLRAFAQPVSFRF